MSTSRPRRLTVMLLSAVALALVPLVSAAAQQATPDLYTGVKVGGSSNVHLLSHIPLGGYFDVMDNEIEQDPGRPYAYVSQAHNRPGFTIISYKDLHDIHVIYHWTIENPELHQGLGGMDGKYFKLDGRYYYVQSFQFSQGSPDGTLGAIVFDVTGLPDTSKVKEVARITYPQAPGGFHNIFAYKHSNGHVYLFTTVNQVHANIYDMAKVVHGDVKDALVGEVPVPETGVQMGNFGYHDFYVGYDPATHQDKFYGAGRGGYYIYDITNITAPKLLTSITGVAGVTWGHTFTPTPDGHFAVTETEYQYAPLRIFDLRPGLEGKVQTINDPVGAWTADWQDLSHNHEVRWPYVFVSAYEDGLQVFDMSDPAHPKTVGWYYTCHCKHESGFGGVPAWHGTSVMNGAFGIKVRNDDGLIFISDSNTGAWFFTMDGFDHWNGNDWGMPNISSAQDWDHGPQIAATEGEHGKLMPVHGAVAARH